MTETLNYEDFQMALDEYWHDRPPASLEDVMALYGVLAVAESGGQLYRTPNILETFVDDGRLITVSLDLTNTEPELTNVCQDTFRDDDVSKLGYSHKSSGRGAKYSLTQIGSKNGNDAEGVRDTIFGRVQSWVDQDSVQSLCGDNGHSDAWILETLDTAFADGSSIAEEIKSTLVDILPAEESIPTVFTVRLKLDPADVNEPMGDGKSWHYPAEVDVLMEAMRRYASANAADKNIDNGASEGEAVGVVSGDHGRVVGTPESPLGVFSVKHPDAQPGLRKTASWRHYPVRDDVAMLFAKGQDLIDSCVFRRGGMEVYALPYFAGEVTGRKAEVLYLAIDSVREDAKVAESDAPPMAQVIFNLRESDDEAVRELAERELRFYTVTMPLSDDKNVIAEEPAASIYWPSRLADALQKTIHGPTLTPAAGGFDTSPNWPLLERHAGTQLARDVAFTKITNHQFTNSAFAYRDEEGDDFRRIVDHRLLAGRSVEASALFEEYMRRYGDESENGDPPPWQIVAQQLVHLETISRAGLLGGIDAAIEPQTPPMTPETDIDTSDVDAIREQRLDAFLDRPLFENTTRRAAALAGVLVGQISRHQDSERGVGRPLDAGTRGDQLTKNGLENALTAAMEKAKVYAQESDYERDLLFPETIDRLLEITEAMPTEWEIDKRELQFCYVLGHAHGRRSVPIALEMYDGNVESPDHPTGDAQSAD